MVDSLACTRAGGLPSKLRKAQTPFTIYHSPLTNEIFLRHNADLLREQPAALRPPVHDRGGRLPEASLPAERLRDLLPDGDGRARPEHTAHRGAHGAHRSEERRVGKECRSRW